MVDDEELPLVGRVHELQYMIRLPGRRHSSFVVHLLYKRESVKALWKATRKWEKQNPRNWLKATGFTTFRNQSVRLANTVPAADREDVFSISVIILFCVVTVV